jgi:hypothetical protein
MISSSLLPLLHYTSTKLQEEAPRKQPKKLKLKLKKKKKAAAYAAAACDSDDSYKGNLTEVSSCHDSVYFHTCAVSMTSCTTLNKPCAQRI